MAATLGQRESAELEWVGVKILTPWARNPRKNAKAVDDVARSIIAFGWGAVILVRGEDDRIIAGHTRARAAQRLKQLWMRARPRDREDWHPDAIRTKDTGEVPIRRKFGLTGAQCDALAVADNKTGEKADWDDELLGSVLSGLADEGLVADLGFDDAELDKLLGDAPEVELDAGPDPIPLEGFSVVVRGPFASMPEVLADLNEVASRHQGVTVQAEAE